VNVLGDDELLHVVLAGALCVGGGGVGAVSGLRRRVAAWPKFFAVTAIAFGFLAACTTVGFSWIRWNDYDRDIRASVESAKAQGYEIRRSVLGDGTAVYKAKNYVVPDGSFYYFANRSPFRPPWRLVVGWSLVSGTIAALVSLITRTVTRRRARA
jgi:hypothetical protein